MPPSFPISYKVAALGIASVLITAVALMLLVVYQSGKYNALAQAEVNGIIDNHLDNTAKSIYNLVRVAHEDTQEKLRTDMRVTQSILSLLGGMRIGERQVTWLATDQMSQKRFDVQLPQIFLGEKPLAINTDPTVETPLIDEVSRQTGGLATLFQRINERGDMLRIATNIVGKDGQRAIGTAILAVHPDGSQNPVIASILETGRYEGRAWVVDSWCSTSYEAVRDHRGRITGMVFVGIPQRNIVRRIQKIVTETRVCRNGYVYILEGTGQAKGSYIVSKGGERDGENVLDIRDNDGRYMIRDIIGAGEALKPGEMATITYRWQNPGELEPQRKIARIAYYEPWGWVIGTSVNMSELQAYQTYLTDGQRQMLLGMAISAGIIVVFVASFAIFLALRITRPIQTITRSVGAFVQRDGVSSPAPGSRDEVEVLSAAFTQMMKNLNETLEGLKASEAKYREIFANAIEGLFQTTFSGEVRSVNHSLATILGYDSPEDFMATVSSISRDCYRRPEDRAELLRDLQEHGSVVCREAQFNRKDGGAIWVSISARLILDKEGKPSLIEGVLINIDERKKAEQMQERLQAQLLQSQKMESVGRLAGGVAHDFNNLLTVILGHLNMVLEELPPGWPLRNDLLEVQKAAFHSAQLTRQLLSFARKQTIAPKALDLNAAVQSMFNILRRLIGEEIDLSWKPGADLWPVYVDPSQIDQILANLCVNARDAISGHGAIVIETSNRSFDSVYALTHSECIPGNYVVLSVSDTGKGIDPATLSHIFEPFFTTKEVGSGTGLGLATVYGAIKQNNGFIDVDSEPGKGSTFHICFPRHSLQPEQTCATAPAAPPIAGQDTILVVEDEPQILQMIKTMLQRLGYTVIATPSPDEAIVQAQQHPDIDLLLTDVIMPKMNGRDLARTLHEKHPNLRCLYMSGYTADVIANKGVLEEGCYFIEKPFERESLATKIREVLESPPR